MAGKVKKCDTKNGIFGCSREFGHEGSHTWEKSPVPVHTFTTQKETSLQSELTAANAEIERLTVENSHLAGLAGRRSETLGKHEAEIDRLRGEEKSLIDLARRQSDYIDAARSDIVKLKLDRDKANSLAVDAIADVVEKGKQVRGLSAQLEDYRLARRCLKQEYDWRGKDFAELQVILAETRVELDNRKMENKGMKYPEEVYQDVTERANSDCVTPETITRFVKDTQQTTLKPTLPDGLKRRDLKVLDFMEAFATGIRERTLFKIAKGSRIDRLMDANLVFCVPMAGGGEPWNAYCVTPEGRALLKEWENE